MDGTNKKSMMLGFDFESETFHAVLELFERMEVAEEIYEDEGAPSQTKQSRVDANQDNGQKNREENPPCLHFLRRNALNSARTNM